MEYRFLSYETQKLYIFSFFLTKNEIKRELKRMGKDLKNYCKKENLETINNLPLYDINNRTAYKTDGIIGDYIGVDYVLSIIMNLGNFRPFEIINILEDGGIIEEFEILPLVEYLREKKKVRD